MLKMIKSSFQGILVISTFLVLRAAKNGPCTTPNGEKAICVPLSVCTIIRDAVFTFNTTATAFARKSQCGYDNEPLLCCGSTAYPIRGTDPPVNKLLPTRAVCGFAAHGDRVLGGELTELGEFPWMVLLGYNNVDDNSFVGFKCGGTLINNRYILTAAHCVRSSPGLKLSTVRLGEWQISTEIDCEEELINDECADPVVDMKIEKQIPHRNYSYKTGDHDIALIRLQNNVVYTDYIRPICLPSFNDPKPAAGFNLVLSGWGTIENGSTSDYKLKLTVPVVPDQECISTIKSRGRVSENQICAGGQEGRDACQGDSGGPLMTPYEDIRYKKQQWYQVGVIAWGIGCGRRNIPAVYTRVAMYLNWILDNMTEF